MEKNRPVESKGTGIQVPPSVQHVAIYFMQKGCAEDLALEFFNYYEQRRWENIHGKLIKNWKATAWEWIWSHL